MQESSPLLPFRNIASLDEEGVAYTEDQFAEDTAAASHLVGDSETASRKNEYVRGDGPGLIRDHRLQRVCDYFYEKYDRSEAGYRYLRFGAVHTAIGKNWDLIEHNGLADPGAVAQIDRFLLLLLLTTPVMVNTDTCEAWIPQGEVDDAIHRARLVRGE